MQKRFVFLIAIVLMVTPVLAIAIRPAESASTTILSQNFDDEPSASAPQGWIVANPSICSLTVNDTIYHGSSGKSARYADMASYPGGTAHVETSFEKQYGRLEFSFAIMPENPDCFNLYIDDGTPTEHHGANIYFLSSGEIAYYADSQWHSLRPFSINTWYQIRMVLDIPANTYDIYIDGSLEAQGTRFRAFGQAAYLTRIIFGGQSYQMPSGYIDDISVVALDYKAPIKTTLTLTGGLDYLFAENVKIKVDASVKDIKTTEPVSNATVNLKIYYPNGSLWVSDNIVAEITSGSGIYEWESMGTISEMNLEKGVYRVQAEASVSNDLPSTDVLLFHIDPPSDAQASPAMAGFYYVAIAIVILAGAIVGMVLLRQHGKELKRQE